MYKIKEINDKELWNSFSQYVFVQSWEWGEFWKSLGKKVWYLGVYDEDDELVSVALTGLIKTRLRTHIYVPAGPVFKENPYKDDYKIGGKKEIKREKFEILEKLLTYLKIVAEENKAAFVRVEPQWNVDVELKENLRQAGLIEAPSHVQANNKWILKINERSEEEIFMDMGSSTRKDIRRAEKRGVRIYKSNKLEDFDKFWECFIDTVERNNFIPMPKDYYKKQYENFGKENKYMLYWAEDLESDFASKRLLTASLVGFTPKVVFALHTGTKSYSNKVLKNAPKLLKWEVIKDAKNRGVEYFDFYGISDSALTDWLIEEGRVSDKVHEIIKDGWYGFSMLKIGFGGYGKRMLKPFDLPVSLRYWLVRTLERTKKLWRKPYNELLKILGKE